MTQHEALEAKLKRQGLEQLAKVKQHESELLKQGWRYVRIDNRTTKLVPPQKS